MVPSPIAPNVYIAEEDEISIAFVLQCNRLRHRIVSIKESAETFHRAQVTPCTFVINLIAIWEVLSLGRTCKALLYMLQWWKNVASHSVTRVLVAFIR